MRCAFDAFDITRLNHRPRERPWDEFAQKILLYFGYENPLNYCTCRFDIIKNLEVQERSSAQSLNACSELEACDRAQ